MEERVLRITSEELTELMSKPPEEKEPQYKLLTDWADHLDLALVGINAGDYGFGFEADNRFMTQIWTGQMEVYSDTEIVTAIALRFKGENHNERREWFFQTFETKGMYERTKEEKEEDWKKIQATAKRKNRVAGKDLNGLVQEVNQEWRNRISSRGILSLI